MLTEELKTVFVIPAGHEITDHHRRVRGSLENIDIDTFNERDPAGAIVATYEKTSTTSIKPPHKTTFIWLTCDLESHPFFVRICPNLLETDNEEIPF